MSEEYWNVRITDIIIVIASSFGLIYLYSLVETLNPQYPFFFYKLVFLLVFMYLEYIIIKAIQDRPKIYQDPNVRQYIDIEKMNRYILFRIVPIILISVLTVLYFLFMNYFNMSWDRMFLSTDIAILVYILIFISIGWFFLKIIINSYIFMTIIMVQNEVGRKIVDKIRFFFVVLVILLFLFHNVSSLKVDNLATWIISILIVTVTLFLYYRTNTFDPVKDWKEKETMVVSSEDEYFNIRIYHFIIMGLIALGVLLYFIIPQFQLFINYNLILAFSFNSIYGYVVLALIFLTLIWGGLEAILIGLAILFRYMISEKGHAMIFRVQFFIILFVSLKLIIFNMQFLYIREDIEYYISLAITLVSLLISYKVGIINLSYKLGVVT